MGNTTIATKTASNHLIRRASLFLLKWAGFLVILAAFAYGAVGLQSARLRQIQSYRPYVDRLILPRTEYAKTLAFGYNMFMADFLYLRSIQAFGGQWRTGMTGIKSIFHYFYTITELDPKFTEAYEFGSLVIGDEAKEPKMAIELNKKGWLANPSTYKLAYLNGYSAFYSLHDIPLAKLWIHLASMAKDCPDFVHRFEYFFDKESGDYQAALERWIWEYLNAIDTREETMLGIAGNQIQMVTNDWNIQTINKAMEAYKKDHPTENPKNLDDLVSGGYFKSFTSCDYFPMMNFIDTLSNQVSPAKATSRLDQICKTYIHQESGVLPTAPFGATPGDDFYFIRRDARPDDFKTSSTMKNVIFTKKMAREFLRERSLPYARGMIKNFKNKYNKFPNPLDEAFKQVGGIKVFDPLTGTWDYDPKTGIIKSPSFPDL